MKLGYLSLFAASITLAIILQSCVEDDGGEATALLPSSSSFTTTHSSSWSSSSSAPFSLEGIQVNVIGDTAYLQGVVHFEFETYFGIIVNGVDVGWYANEDYEADNLYDFTAAHSYLGPEDLINGENTLVAYIYWDGTPSVVTYSDTIHFQYLLPEDPDPVIEDTPATFASEITLGAQGSNYGGFLDLDSWTVYTGSDVANYASDIDLVLWNSPDDGLVVMTPTDAITHGYMATTLVARGGYESVFIPISLTEAEFDAIEYLSDLPIFDIEDWYTTMPVSSGTAFYVATDQWEGGNEGLFVVFVTESVSGNSGTIKVKALHG